MDKMREEFEAFINHAGNWNYDMEINKDGFFVSYLTQRVFNSFVVGWQASRAALKVELPATCNRALVYPQYGTNEVGMEHDEYFEVDDIKQMLSEAGISYE